MGILLLEAPYLTFKKIKLEIPHFVFENVAFRYGAIPQVLPPQVLPSKFSPKTAQVSFKTDIIPYSDYVLCRHNHNPNPTRPSPTTRQPPCLQS